MSAPITVDIWSDIACPWCYIGKRKFEAGLAEFDGRDDVEVTYHSFELAPDTPVDFDGSEVDFLVRHKGMPADQVRGMLDQVRGIAAEVGLDYDFDRLQHTKTLKAHEALHFAKAHGRQADLAERLFQAYFEQGRHSAAPTNSPIWRPMSVSIATPCWPRSSRASTPRPSRPTSTKPVHTGSAGFPSS